MFLMKNQVRPYAWGSRTAISALLGESVPSTEPLVDTNLPTTPPPSVDIDNPPVPSFTDPPVTDSSAP